MYEALLLTATEDDCRRREPGGYRMDDLTGAGQGAGWFRVRAEDRVSPAGMLR
jgi:hypothetical protein